MPLLFIVHLIVNIGMAETIECNRDSTEETVTLLSGRAPNGGPASLANMELQDMDLELVCKYPLTDA